MPIKIKHVKIKKITIFTMKIKLFGI